jgi:hypothetical protein
MPGMYDWEVEVRAEDDGVTENSRVRRSTELSRILPGEVV